MRWMGLGLALGLLWCAAAPAAVTVDGRANCFALDDSRAQTVHLAPGLFRVEWEGEGIVYGASTALSNLRCYNLIVDCDPAAVNVVAPIPDSTDEGRWPAAAVDGSQGYPLLEVLHPTVIRLYLVDHLVEGNRGSLDVRVQRYLEETLEWHTVAGRVVHAASNCYELDFAARAKPVTLEPGWYTLKVLDGAVSYGTTRRYAGRAASGVLIDCRPDQVEFGSEGYVEPAAIGVLSYPGDVLSLEVRERTTLYLYLVDRDPADNEGSVTISFVRDAAR